MLTRETRSFRPAHKNKVHFDPLTKIKSISILTLKTSQSLSPTQNQVNHDPNTEVRSMSIPTLKTSQFCTPPDTKTNLISVQNLSQVVSTPTKPSQIWAPHWNQVNSDPPYWNHFYFDHTRNNQVNFDANTRTMLFSGRVTLRVYIPVNILAIQ